MHTFALGVYLDGLYQDKKLTFLRQIVKRSLHTSLFDCSQSSQRLGMIELELRIGPADRFTLVITFFEQRAF